ncbi:MAG: hypothetical protein RI935_781 [Candidatus Parcubacteria bacterium]|jgi:four helix bundle protein
MKDYKKLQVWQKSYSLGMSIYTLSKEFPKEEIYGLTSQIRRSCLSIPCNLAEGSRKSTDEDFRSFVHIAYGSCAEVEVQLMYAKEFGYIKVAGFIKPSEEISQISRMLNGLITTLS